MGHPRPTACLWICWTGSSSCARPPPSPDDAARVLALRASVEGVTLDAPALAALAAAAGEASLRHAVGLLSPASVLARAAGREGVTEDDVASARGLFWDAKTSARTMAAEGGYVS